MAPAIILFELASDSMGATTTLPLGTAGYLAKNEKNMDKLHIICRINNTISRWARPDAGVYSSKYVKNFGCNSLFITVRKCSYGNSCATEAPNCAFNIVSKLIAMLALQHTV